MTVANKMDAPDVLRSLARHHNGDVFVAECKNGAGGRLRLDAWAMKRSYSPWTTIAYEIKVSRQDFKNDNKYLDYLNLCHEFYFACPAGLIQPSEIPEGIGLVWISKSGRTHVRKKSARNKPDTDSIINLLTYVVMSRSVIVENMYEANDKIIDYHEKRREEYQREIEIAEKNKHLAYFVSGHIKKHCQKIEEENKKAERVKIQCDQLSDFLGRYNIDWLRGDMPYANFAVEKIHNILNISQKVSLENHITNVENALRLIKNQLSEWKTK